MGFMRINMLKLELFIFTISTLLLILGYLSSNIFYFLILNLGLVLYKTSKEEGEVHHHDKWY